MSGVGSLKGFGSLLKKQLCPNKREWFICSFRFRSCSRDCLVLGFAALLRHKVDFTTANSAVGEIKAYLANGT